MANDIVQINWEQKLLDALQPDFYIIVSDLGSEIQYSLLALAMYSTCLHCTILSLTFYFLFFCHSFWIHCTSFTMIYLKRKRKKSCVHFYWALFFHTLTYFLLICLQSTILSLVLLIYVFLWCLNGTSALFHHQQHCFPCLKCVKSKYFVQISQHLDQFPVARKNV